LGQKVNENSGRTLDQEMGVAVEKRVEGLCTGTSRKGGSDHSIVLHMRKTVWNRRSCGESRGDRYEKKGKLIVRGKEGDLKAWDRGRREHAFGS